MVVTVCVVNGARDIVVTNGCSVFSSHGLFIGFLGSRGADHGAQACMKI